ncbi:UNVERIFIED_CONTAM: hypothetical protein Sradi_3841300 [Sesamum radiatum]|uniref:PDZ domain-containing protein n=1 Tax=Sesamum radiatum TaxID=300843 RepID=A0AAW2Q1W0_SESRA
MEKERAKFSGWSNGSRGQLIEPLLGRPCEGVHEYMALDPGGVTVEKGNILKAGDVLLRIRGSVILRQVRLLPVEGEFVLP